MITIQSGTQGTDELPPTGVPLSRSETDRLPEGIRLLIKAMETLAEAGVLSPSPAITIQDTPLGHRFTGMTPGGERVPFYECFGQLVETLNRVMDEQHFHLLIVSPTRRTGISRLLAGDLAGRLVLDLNTSILFVKDGGPDDRYIVCADGSPSSRRLFPFLKELLPAVRDPLEIIWVKKPEAGQAAVQAAEQFLAHAGDWLTDCGRKSVVHRLQGARPADLILQAAGSDAVIVLGASLRHDLYRRLRGSLPLEVITKTKSSVLLVKLPHEADAEFFQAPFTC